MIKHQEILDNLCYYDKRNPDYNHWYPEEKPENCYCDNCFHGNHRLAKELLRLKAKLKRR